MSKSKQHHTSKTQQYIEPCRLACSKSELDLFAPMLVQTDEESANFLEIQPTNAINDTCIEFQVHGTPEDYLDLANTYLHVNVRVTKHDKSAIAATEKVAPINNFLHALFSQIDVYMNNTLVSSNDNLYPYRAYLETLLSYGDEAKDGPLAMSLWHKDTGGKMDSADPTETDATKKNDGLIARAKYTNGSKSFEMLGRIHADLFHQNRLILSNCDLRLRFVRSKEAFMLQSSLDTANYKVCIDNARLCVRKVKLSNERAFEIERSLAANSIGATYPIKRVEVKTFTIPSNTTSSTQTLYTGRLPSRIILGMVTNTAANGSYKENPFNFQHFKIKVLALNVNGKSIPGSAIDMDFSKNEYLKAYFTLLHGMGKSFRNTNIGINRDEFANGYTLWAFDLTPDTSCGHSSLGSDGEVRLDIKLESALTNAAALVCYSESDGIIAINKDRNVSML
jgi:hypothetical protein